MAYNKIFIKSIADALRTLETFDIEKTALDAETYNLTYAKAYNALHTAIGEFVTKYPDYDRVYISELHFEAEKYVLFFIGDDTKPVLKITSSGAA